MRLKELHIKIGDTKEQIALIVDTNKRLLPYTKPIKPGSQARDIVQRSHDWARSVREEIQCNNDIIENLKEELGQLQYMVTRRNDRNLLFRKS